jgi:hypothetical protein
VQPHRRVVGCAADDSRTKRCEAAPEIGRHEREFWQYIWASDWALRLGRKLGRWGRLRWGGSIPLPPRATPHHCIRHGGEIDACETPVSGGA